MDRLRFFDQSTARLTADIREILSVANRCLFCYIYLKCDIIRYRTKQQKHKGDLNNENAICIA